MKKISKTVLIASIRGRYLFLIYSLIPRVIHSKGEFGNEFKKSDALSKKQRKKYGHLLGIYLTGCAILHSEIT